MEKLYSIEVIEREGDRLKVRYVGYSSKYDEWKDKSEIEVTYLKDFSQDVQAEDQPGTIRSPFSL